MLWSKIFDFRGYLLFAIVSTWLLAQGAVIVLMELSLILCILALSKDGPRIFGHPSRGLRRLSCLQTPFAAACLMLMPVKTFTALFGAASNEEMAAIALNQTIALIGLAIVLGCLYSLFIRRSQSLQEGKSDQVNATPPREKSWVVIIDVLIIMLLLAFGKDGEVLFGNLAVWLQSTAPIAEEPWVRGLISIIPVKTVSTLMLAETWDKRAAISINAVPLLGVLATLTFGFFFFSQFGTALAFIIGPVFALLMLKSTSNYKQYLKVA